MIITCGNAPWNANDALMRQRKANAKLTPVPMRVESDVLEGPEICPMCERPIGKCDKPWDCWEALQR